MLVRLQLDEKIMEKIERLAKELGVKPNAYLQMIIGLHVKEKEGSDAGKD